MVEELRSMKRKEAAKKMDDGIEETLTYCDFSNEHWTFIRTNKGGRTAGFILLKVGRCALQALSDA